MFGPKKSLRRAILIVLAIGVSTFFVLAIPSLFDQGHVIDDLIHGMALQVALICFLPLLLAVVGIGYVAQHPNSRLNSRLAAYPYSLVTLASLMFPFIVPQILDHYRASDLVGRGVPMQARLVREYASECGKAGCTAELQYSFVPHGAVRPVSGSVRVGSSSRDPDSAYAYATETHTVPILYDPQNPTHSMLYWHDEIARQATWSGTFGFIGVLLGICTLVWAFFVVLAELSLRQQKRTKVAAGTAPIDTNQLKWPPK